MWWCRCKRLMKYTYRTEWSDLRKNYLGFLKKKIWAMSEIVVGVSLGELDRLWACWFPLTPSLCIELRMGTGRAFMKTYLCNKCQLGCETRQGLCQCKGLEGMLYAREICSGLYLVYVSDLVQDCGNCIASAMELLKSCPKQLTYSAQ